MSKVYTPSEIAQITGLSYAAIRRCMDDGLLEFFKLPGGKHFKITQEQLDLFQERLKVPDGLNHTTLLTEGETIEIEHNGLIHVFSVVRIQNNRIVVQDVEDSLCKEQPSSDPVVSNETN